MIPLSVRGDYLSTGAPVRVGACRSCRGGLRFRRGDRAVRMQPISGVATVRGRRGLLALLLVALLALVAACGGGGGSGDEGAKGKATEAAKPRPSRARVAVEPGDGAKGVATDDALKVTSAKGKLT